MKARRRLFAEAFLVVRDIRSSFANTRFRWVAEYELQAVEPFHRSYATHREDACTQLWI